MRVGDYSFEAATKLMNDYIYLFWFLLLSQRQLVCNRVLFVTNILRTTSILHNRKKNSGSAVWHSNFQLIIKKVSGVALFMRFQFDFY